MSTIDNTNSTERKHKMRANAPRYLSIVIGTAILAFGLYNIHSRCGISEGGVLGLSLLIYQWIHISPGLSGLVLDAICFGVGTLVMGKRFLGESIAASVLYSCWYEIFEYSGPILPDLTCCPPAASVLGGLFVGVGCGIVVLNDCAIGGDDAMALSVHKLTGMKISLFYIFSDFIVLLLSLTYIPIYRFIWSILTVLISSEVIEALRRTKAIKKKQKEHATIRKSY